MTEITVSLSEAFLNKELKIGQPEHARAYSYLHTTTTPAVLFAHVLSGKAWTPGTFTGDHRKSEHFQSAQVLALDIDDHCPPPYGLAQHLDIRRYAALIHPTASYTDEHPKCRVLFILDKPIASAEKYGLAMRALLHHFSYLGVDASTADAARGWYGSTVRPELAIQRPNALLPVVTLGEWVAAFQAWEKERGNGAGRGQYDGTLPDTLLADIVRGLGADTSALSVEGYTRKPVACPVRKHEHDEQAPAFYWNAERGFGKCFKCGSNYNANNTALALGLDAGSYYRKAPTAAIDLSAAPGGNGQSAALKAPQLSTLSVQFVRDRFVEATKNPNWIPGLRTDIGLLDMITGGLLRKNVYVVVGETGNMKTQLCMGVAWAVMQQAPVLILSYENSDEAVMERLVAHGARLENVGYSDFAKGCRLQFVGNGVRPERFSAEEQRRVLWTYDRLADFQKGGRFEIIKNIGVMDMGALYLKLGEWISQKQIGLVIWDGFGDAIIPGASIFERTTTTMQYVQNVATQYDVAVLGTSQGGRNTKARTDKELGLHDGAGGQAIENIAAAHFSIYDPYQLSRRGQIKYSDIDQVECPPGHALIKVNKLRAGSLKINKVLVKNLGGAGFYHVDEERR